jgi:transcriptional regulator with XRE-family HTH domain
MSHDELKRKRKALGMTQRELADLLKVDPMTVSRWERGQHHIPESVALALMGLKAKKSKGGNP